MGLGIRVGEGVKVMLGVGERTDVGVRVGLLGTQENIGPCTPGPQSLGGLHADIHVLYVLPDIYVKVYVLVGSAILVQTSPE